MKNRLYQLLVLIAISIAAVSCEADIDANINPEISTPLPEEVLFFPETEYNKLDSAMGMDGKLKLSVALNNPYHLAKEGNEYIYFYVNLAAAEYIPQHEPLPLNLSLVIDRSGSMMDGNKMQHVIRAAQSIINQLGPKDWVSVVSYSDDVTVEVASGQVSNKKSITDKLAHIAADGMTNLEGGMLEGFEQVRKTYKKGYINRVILLSDGQANVGETDPNKLNAVARKWYQDKDISITTFGVGLDYNENLMTTLADAGRGNYYFVANSEQIDGIFKKELSGMLSTVARNIALKVTYPGEYFEFVEVYGFEPEVTKNTITINLHDLLSAEDKSLLVKCRRLKTPTEPLAFKAAIAYTPTFGAGTPGQLEVGTYLTPTNDSTLMANHYQKTVYQTLLLETATKNYELAAQLVDDGNYELAQEQLLLNSDLFSRNGFYAKDSTVVSFNDYNTSYAASLDTVSKMDDSQVKFMQKDNKANVYDYKRKGKK